MKQLSFKKIIVVTLMVCSLGIAAPQRANAFWETVLLGGAMAEAEKHPEKEATIGISGLVGGVLGFLSPIPGGAAAGAALGASIGAIFSDEKPNSK